MSSTIILLTVVTLSLLGVVSAIVLYFVAQKFKVFEDPRIDDVEGLLPGANCGGCGYPGCRGMADALVKADDLSSLFCPVGGNETMGKIAHYLGKTVAEKEPRVAVVRCQGSPEHRKPTNVYDGAMSCAISASLYSGDTGCQYGCLGYGDCVSACNFDAIHINLVTKLPEVIDDKCTACGACVTACPKNIIELRRKRPKDRKIFVSCVSMDKGAISRKACKVSCIGCGKCVKVCAFDAITLQNNLAYIDAQKCTLCRKCVEVCPTNAILELNFPPRKKTEVAEGEVSGSL
jgi:electron transport complex, RnfABCDGE type, B subunit